MAKSKAKLEQAGLMQGGTSAKYATGFVLSLVLTILAYLVVTAHVNSNHTSLAHSTIVYIISVLAIGQFFVQVVYFLHLGKESNPQWNRMLLAFMTLVVLIVFFGSLWIMENLDYHHGGHQSDTTTEEIMTDEAIHKHAH